MIRNPRKRFFVPEVVQTSEMDCGPASLKALLEGFGVVANYGRLREACQTSVDGTSIDTLEEVAVRLGLQAEQIMLPADHLLLDEARALPALVVVRLPNGLTHFVVVWSRHGNWVQVMDPGAGRRWLTARRFLDELFVHRFPVPAVAWREWAGTSGFLDPLRRRLRDLSIPDEAAAGLESRALADPGWRSLAALDAATRLIAAVVRAGGLEAGNEAGALLERLFESNRRGPVRPSAGGDGTAMGLPIPPPYWSVEPMPPEASPGAGAHLLLRGAVLVRVTGVRALAAAEGEVAEVLSPDLAAVLAEPPPRPDREIWRALRQDGLLTPGALAAALGMASLGVTVQALLFQGLLRLGQSFNLVGQRIGALSALFVFLAGLFLLELPITAVVQRIGRRLETRLRVLFLEKIPRLGDHYFHSRLTSDMTQRAHDLRQLRALPALGVEASRLFFQLVLTSAGVIWLQPASASLAVLSALAFVALSWAAYPALEERDLRLRSHLGGLSRFYLDALLGLIPLRMHGAERGFRRQHESLLVEWVRAGFDFERAAVALQGAGAVLYSGFAVWMLFDYVAKGGEVGGVLLLFYWTLNLPKLGQTLVESVQRYPTLRNRVLRMLEPLGAPDEDEAGSPLDAVPSGKGQDSGDRDAGGTRIEMRGGCVRAGGHTILEDISFDVRPGDHLAIVGPSGAGKSSLVGILLGWHRPAGGECLVDGQPLDGARLRRLRRETAWVDPAVQLWNRTLMENLTYGNDAEASSANGLSIEDADLFAVFERLENGLQTVLGEGGGLVSGGEGQRVRLGRAMNRGGVRLVILDEPFRGLHREQRRSLLRKAREFWREATLICVTHDVGETLSFGRVLLIEAGRIVEDGDPSELAARPDSRYRAMLDAETRVREGMWGDVTWRRLWMEEGRLTDRVV